MFQVLNNGSDVSGAIKSITPIEYRMNDDYTFELPEVYIGTTSSGFSVGDTITVKQNESAQVSFYVAAIEYDYATQMYSLRCPHILHRLTKYRVGVLTVEWSGISPSYAQYNNQSGVGQGQLIWGRQYYQVLFLIQMLIRKATGLAVASIDVSVGEKPSFYYTTAWDPLMGWVSEWRNYATLGVSLQSLARLGSKKHTDHPATDFETAYAKPNCLELLRWLCASCALSIDIFRADYQVVEIDISAPPSDSATMGKRSLALEMYRNYIGVAARLETGSFDYIYGEYDDMGHFQPYTYGVPGADYSILPYQAESIDTGTPDPKVLSMTYPNMFKLYFVNDRGDYRSGIYDIADGENGLNWLDMWVAQLAGHWMNVGTRYVYEIIAPGLQYRHRRVEIDVATRKMTYEVLA